MASLTSRLPQEQAVAAAEMACQLTDYKTPGFLTILAAAHAEAGNFPEAIRWQTQTLDFADYTRNLPHPRQTAAETL